MALEQQSENGSSRGFPRKIRGGGGDDDFFDAERTHLGDADQSVARNSSKRINFDVLLDTGAGGGDRFFWLNSSDQAGWRPLTVENVK